MKPKKPQAFFTRGKGRNRRVIPLNNNPSKNKRRISSVLKDTYVDEDLSIDAEEQAQMEEDDFEGSESLIETMAVSKLGREAERAAVVELTNFQVPFLSGNYKSTIVTTSDNSFAAQANGTVILPDWGSFDIPLKGVDKWAVYRIGTWHETQHLKWTPKDLYTYGSENPNEGPRMHWFVNVVEDRRIETLGVEYHKGAKAPLMYEHAYCYSVRPDVSVMYEKAKMYGGSVTGTSHADTYIQRAVNEMRMEAYLQGVVSGKVKGLDKLPIEEQKIIVTAINKSIKDVDNLASKCKDWNISGKKGKEITAEVARIAKQGKEDLQLTEAGSFDQPPQTDSLSPDFSQQQRSKNNQSEAEQQQQVQEDIDEYLSGKPKKQKEQGKETKQNEKGKGEEGEESDKDEEGKKEKKGKGKESDEEGEDGEGEGEGKEGKEEKKGKGKGKGKDSEGEDGEESDEEGEGKGKSKGKGDKNKEKGESENGEGEGEGDKEGGGVSCPHCGYTMNNSFLRGVKLG